MKQKEKIKQLETRVRELESKKSVTGWGVLRFLLMVGAFIGAWFNYQFILSSWEFLGLGELLGSDVTGIHQLLILGPVFLEYGLIAFGFISLVAWHKHGYGNLKAINEDGLIVGLIYGLIYGLIAGVIVGLIAGLIYGLIAGLIVGLIEEYD